MGQDDKAPGNPFGDPASIDDMASMYLSAVKSILASLKEAEKNSDGSASDIMYVLAQAQTRWLTTALRYWTQIATIVTTQGTDAVNAIKPGEGGPSEEAKRLILLDKARATLREISDLSLSEAKMLQRDLMSIEEELRSLVGPEPEGKDPHRFQKYKS
jgi:hypothetical protein